ncbi:MAG: GAF domain-containing sensor histidine kinase [Mycobacteriaceae bacterium]|nr:GAF domain-containing sensor histidine kinase [Mycobacteriaceae bacterium]MBV9638227.1 GAF domain-containing sensor histidine kinase [Mycobacteriaceae bacterium]
MASDEDSAFARLGRRGLVEQMHQHLDELLAARDQMERLLELVVDIGSDLDLNTTLRRTITAAMRLTGAQYGALGVRGPDGALAEFLHAGIDAETVGQIGRLPVGKGLLGLLLNQTNPVRLDDLSTHPATVGFPAHHPPMRAFLGAPITIRGEVFGSLYLAGAESHPFSESDETAARALASAAAFAIDNAQLFERVRTSAKWTKASREITTALLAEIHPNLRPLQLIVDRARELTDAEQAIVLVPTDADQAADEIDTLIVSAAVGINAEQVVGQCVPVDGSTTGGVFRSGAPLITESFRHPIAAFTDVGERPAIVMPLRARDTVLGVIAVARNAQRPPFDSGYLDLVSDFADHAAIALTLTAARDRARELTLLADRERIAHDLHDHVIQRLFAAGMDLQGTIARSRSPEVTQRLGRTLDTLQSTIDDIRATIFKLQSPSRIGPVLRQRIHDVVRELTENRDITTTLQLSGPMTAVSSELAEHAEAVISETISNTLRHSGATTLRIEVSVEDDLIIDVVDNGQGIPADNQRRSGLGNLRRRAEQVGGSCEVSSPPSGGTRVRWSAPLIGI